MITQKTIIIVDDFFADREIYHRYLRREDRYKYKIFEAESGEEASALFYSVQPDLILLDYHLPDCDGLELIELWKNQSETMPPIIMLTGQGNEEIAVKVMKIGAKDYLVKGKLTSESLRKSVYNILQQHHLESLLFKNKQQQKFITEISLRIRQSLSLEDILNTAVTEVHKLLKCDRVVIYRFNQDLTGKVVAESVEDNWSKSLNAHIEDLCFHQSHRINRYKQGYILATNDIYQSGLSPCHLDLLQKFQVKANLVVPLVPTSGHNDRALWGLLIAHQCDGSRNWQEDELELLDKLGVQLAIAVQQAELLANLKSELEKRTHLEAELERLVRVLENSQDYVGLADAQGKVIWTNPQLREVLHLDEQISWSLPSIAKYYPQWALELIKNQGIPHAVCHGSWLGETALKTKDGREIPVSQLIIAHKSPDGTIEYLSTVMRDLSEQKQSEHLLQARATELEWLNLEFLKTTNLLKQRNQELDEFAYVVSHDLKAPLRAIANLANWLSEDLDGQLSEENQHQLDLLQSRVERMDSFIQALLQYSRVGRQSKPEVIVNVANLLQETIEFLSPPPEFTIEIAPQMPTFITDAVALQQVFTNLISNAIKYHHSSAGKVVVSVTEQPAFFEFAVSDNGPGIAREYHQKIFVIFQTLASKDTIESTGVGLSIVKKVVENQGGQVRVESQVGQGSTFYFTWRKQSSKSSI